MASELQLESRLLLSIMPLHMTISASDEACASINQSKLLDHLSCQL